MKSKQSIIKEQTFMIKKGDNLIIYYHLFTYLRVESTG
jgi:hypothetical protein